MGPEPVNAKSEFKPATVEKPVENILTSSEPTDATYLSNKNLFQYYSKLSQTVGENNGAKYYGELSKFYEDQVNEELSQINKNSATEPAQSRSMITPNLNLKKMQLH